MLSLFRVIASALFSWLNSLRGEPTGQHLKRQVAPNPDRDDSRETGTAAILATTENPSERGGVEEHRQECGAADSPNDGVFIESSEEAVGVRGELDHADVAIPRVGPESPPANAATSDEELPIGGEMRPRTTEEATRTIDEHLHDAAERAIGTGDDDATQLSEAAATREVEDLRIDEGIEEIDLVPRESGGESDAGKCERQGKEAVVGSVAESPRKAEQLAREKEIDDAAEAADSIEPFAKAVAADPVDRIGSRAGELEGTAEDSGGSSGANARESNPESESNGPMPRGASTGKGEPGRTPAYRAPAGGPQPRPVPRARLPHAERSPPGDRAAPIHVRVVFQRGGYCAVSLLPCRLPGLPERLIVSSTDGEVALVALQDDWYQDVVPGNLGDLLREGLVWNCSDIGQEWLLSGREVFVLAHGTTHRGFVSCARLTLGRRQLVLCTVAQLGPVEDALRVAGCTGWSQLHQDDGAPSGWCLLRDVVPQKPVPQSSASDILNILRPLPEIEVALEGGVRLAHSNWLLGYPPAIKIYGDPEHTDAVLIDGKRATVSEPGGYVAPGWDAEGSHQVSCTSTNKRYSLVRIQANWAYWPAYSFTMSSARGDDSKFEFCGPVVRPVTINGESNHRQVVQVPATNPILIGACPGQVFSMRSRPDLWGARCLGLPPFDAVWALPRQPLHCEKCANKILRVRAPTPGVGSASQKLVGGRRDLKRWCLLILDATRKGLAVEPASPPTAELWKEYKQVARSLWRRLR